jgi:hypothetical protein
MSFVPVPILMRDAVGKTCHCLFVLSVSSKVCVSCRSVGIWRRRTAVFECVAFSTSPIKSQSKLEVNISDGANGTSRQPYFDLRKQLRLPSMTSHARAAEPRHVYNLHSYTSELEQSPCTLQSQAVMLPALQPSRPKVCTFLFCKSNEELLTRHYSLYSKDSSPHTNISNNAPYMNNPLSLFKVHLISP